MTDDIDIRQMKLVSGEDIICLVASDNKGTYMIERPLVVETINQAPGKYALMPWFAFSSSNLISIDKSDVIAHAVADDAVKMQYINLTINADDDQQDLFDDDLYEEEQLDFFDSTDTDPIIH